METNHRVHRPGVRNKLKLVAGNGVENPAQKSDGPFQRLRIVKRGKAAGKHLPHRPRPSQWSNLILLAVFDNKDAADSCLPGHSKRSFSVPGRSVHPQLAMIQPQDNAVIAEDLRIAQRLPELGGGTLARARVT